MHHYVFARTPIVKSSMKFRNTCCLFFLLNLQVTDCSKVNQKRFAMVSFLCGIIISTSSMSNVYVHLYQCRKKMSVLKILRFQVEFLKSYINLEFNFLQRFFSNTPSKSCFCYLVKFLTAILHLLILFIFF